MSVSKQWLKKQGFSSVQAVQSQPRVYTGYDHYGDYSGPATSCCSTLELSSISTCTDAAAYVLDGIRRRYRSMIYYSVNPTLTRYLKSVGFVEAQRYMGNHNKYVVILVLKV